MAARRSLLALPPLAGLVAVVLATGKGLYVSPDAVFYVGTARNWLDGHGLTPPAGLPPLAHFPPLFTVLLAAVGRLGLDPLDAARVMNALALAGTVLLVGLVVRARASSVPAGLVAAVLTVAAVDLLTYSSSALSEPVFILLSLAGLVVLAAHLERPRPALLAGASALLAAAFLTRYVGVALVLAGVGVLLWRRRRLDAAVFGAVTVLPVAAWLAWAGGRGPSDRSLVVHLFGADYLGQAVRPVSRWLVPWPGPPLGALLALAVVVVVLWAAKRPSSTVSALVVAFAVAYLAVVFANRAFTDATGRLDARFLAPLHVLAIVLVVPALRGRIQPVLAAVLVMGQVIGALAWTVGGLSDDGVRRRGYTAAVFDRSPVLTSVPDGPVYSNAFDLIELRGGRASPIPAKTDYLTGRTNPRYAEELAAMHGYVAYVDAVTFRRSFLPSRAELEAALPLEVVLRDEVGTLYRIR